MAYFACKVMVDVTLDASRVGCDVKDEVFRIVQDQLIGKVINNKATVVVVQPPDPKDFETIKLDPLSGKPMGSVPVVVVMQLAVKEDVVLGVVTQSTALGVFASTGASPSFIINGNMPHGVGLDDSGSACVWTTGSQADAPKLTAGSLLLHSIMSGGESEGCMGYIGSMITPGCLLL